MADKRTLFDTLYAAADAAVKALQKPNRERMLKRAAERAADELESKQIAAEAQRADLEHRLANVESEDEALRIYKSIAGIDREISEAKELVVGVQGEYSKLFGPAPEALA